MSLSFSTIAQGPQGPTGFTGFTGFTGYTGYTGLGNFTGFTGFTGYTGYTGYTGPSGGGGVSNYATGTTSFSSTTTTTITCGFQPKYVMIKAAGANPSNGATQQTWGSSDGSSNACVGFTADSSAGSTVINGTSNAWIIGYGSNTSSNQSGVVNNFTSTSFDLANTFTNGGNTPSAFICWVAIK